MIDTNVQRRSTAQKTRNTLQQHISCLYRRALVLVLMSFLVVSPTWALTINLTFDSGASDSPSFDSSGALLQSIMEAAAAMWEDIIHDSGTLDIEYYYDDLSDANSTLASHNNLAVSGGKPTSARVRFDTQTGGTERNWFFDPTPTNHDEYDLQQTLFRDLSAANQTSWFNDSPPDLLEVGFRGGLSEAAPTEAVGAFDILSTAIHELGHAVGLTGNVSSGEYADGDYDVPSNFVGGVTMAIEGNAHVDPRVALMCSGCGATELRRLPTATDVFAAATGAGWTNIDLPRQDMWSGGDMNDASKWEGDAIPGSADHAFVRHGGIGMVTGNLRFQDLTIAEDSWVQTGSNTLEVDNDTVVTRETSATTQIFVDTGGTLMTEDLRLFGAELDMNGGTLTVTDFFEIQPDDETNTNWEGELTGNGIVDVADQLENDGIIRPDGGALTFRSIASDAFDLDGDDGTGRLDASVGDVIFDTGGLRDDHDGDIIIGGGHFVRFDFDWELGSGGDIDMNGTSTTVAELDGPGTAMITGDISAEGQSRLDTDLIFNPAADVSTVDADTVLKLGVQRTDLITYHGGDFTGPGKIQQNGDATVTNGSTVNISVDKFDFDGTTVSDTTIENGATMHITSNTLNDAVSGNLIVNGTLNMDLSTSSSWDLDGSLVVNGGGVVDGVELNLNGALSTAVGGTGIINAPLDIGSNSSLEITAASDTLNLKGTTIWDGPTSATGLGNIVQYGDATFTSNTTISVGLYNMDGSGSTAITVNPSVHVTLNVNSIDQTDGFDGTLNLNSGLIEVNTSAPWSMEGTTNMDTASGTAHIDGQTLEIAGTIHATGGGTAHLDSDVVMQPGAHVNVAADTRLQMDGTISFTGGTISTAPASTVTPAVSRVELNGFTNYDGGTLTVNGIVWQDGDAAVNMATTISGDRFDMDGGSGGNTVWTLDNDLTLNVLGIEQVTNNNTFNGTININNHGHQITVNTADPWTMAGTLNVTVGTHFTFPSIDGQDFTLEGQANIEGGTRFHSITNLTGTVDLLNATSNLALTGGDLVDANTIGGGTVNGPAGSTLRIDAGRSLVGFGDINTGAHFKDGSVVLADNGTLSVNGELIDFGVIGTNDTDGNLQITNSWNTSLADQLQLSGGTVSGAQITNGGLTTGFGTIQTVGFDNSATLTAMGGTLTLDTVAIPDLDGSLNSGVINAVNGDVEVTAAGGISVFQGTLNVGDGFAFRMLSRRLNNEGLVSMNGGTAAVAAFRQASQLRVHSGAAATIVSPNQLFGSPSNNLIEDDLQIDGSAQVESGANFVGAGRMIVLNGSTLQLLDGATMGIDVINSGLVLVGSSPGLAKVVDFEQTSRGEWVVELGGTLPGTEYDALLVTGNATLAGSLAMQPIAPYVDPAVRGTVDEFDILIADSVVGTFDDVSYDAIPLTPTFVDVNGSFRSHQGNGLFRNVNYTRTSVEVENLLAMDGDVDGDRDIDITDYNILMDNFDPNGLSLPNEWIEGNFDNDNDIDMTDFGLLSANFSPGFYGAASTIPEPTAFCLWLAGCLFLGMFYRQSQFVAVEHGAVDRFSPNQD